MKYLKTHESFFSRKSEPFEDSDTMAWFQLFQSRHFIAFNYRKILIKDIEEIKNLISIYNETYISEKEWSGGPINRKFDDFFINKYKKVLGDLPNFKYNNPYKPEISIVFDTDYGFYHIGFSIRNKKMSSIYSTTFDIENTNEFNKEIINLHGLRTTEYRNRDQFYIKVIDEMRIVLNNFYNKKTIGEVFDELNLDNNFDWNWSE